MITIFDFLSSKTTNDKILEVLIENENLDVAGMVKAIQEKYPKLSCQYITSAFWELHNTGRISVLPSDNEIIRIAICQSSRAHLKGIYETKTASRAWDITKIFIGFIPGILAGWLASDTISAVFSAIFHLLSLQ